MNQNVFVVILIWIIVPLVLSKITPRNRLREAIATLIFFQMLTWLLGIFLTYIGLDDPPFRIFIHATRTNFTMDYFVLPFFAVLFQLTFTKNAPFIRRVLHYLVWVGILLLTLFLLGKFTDLTENKMENLIINFFNFIIEFWICRRYLLWFMLHPNYERFESNEH